MEIDADVGGKTAAVGTGVVLTSTGKVLTSDRVLQGTTSFTVTDAGNSRTYSAALVGSDATADVAVLQMKGASSLQTASFGNSATVAVGQSVISIGATGSATTAGSAATMSATGGTVIALNQSMPADSVTGAASTEPLTGLIESSAAVQSEGAGGPLVNTSGQVVGFAAETGVEYSVPANSALSAVKHIETAKQTETGTPTTTTTAAGPSSSG